MKKFRCKVCGYIYEGDELPADYVCPLCHKGPEYFEEVKEAPAAEGGNALKGTKTAENLATAFAGESQARNKYTYFADVARREGYEQLAEIFLSTARNEQEHARLWLELLGGIGDIRGAMLGGFILGIAQIFATAINSTFGYAVGFIILIVILLVKPAGIMGKLTTEKV